MWTLCFSIRTISSDSAGTTISDNTKVFVRYNMQRETQQFPVGLWATAAEIASLSDFHSGENRSDSITASLTTVQSIDDQ
jgi:hypothetical protein